MSDLFQNYTLVALEGEEQALHDALAELLVLVRPQTGCISATLYRDTEDARRFLLIEVWRSKEDQQAAGKAIGKAAFERVFAATAEKPLAHTLAAVNQAA
jgi:quinol monooxygenase YgiN